jgi:hypothetical protein
MRCCEACFDDNLLKDFIRRQGERGSCQYCRARSKYVIDASELEPLFIRFTSLYSPANPGINLPPDAFGVGEPLATLIQDQWQIFSERLTALERHHDLLNEIFTANRRNEEILEAPEVRDLWTDRDWMHSTLLNRWEELAHELKYPEQHPPVATALQPTEHDLAYAIDSLKWFEEDVGRATKTLPAGSQVFRVRLDFQKRDYRIVPMPTAEMGAPPPERVTEPGRANRSGVSYFYGAEDENTAVAEKRPHRGMIITLAVGETVRDLRLIDLPAGMRLSSPFECGEEYLSSLLESCELFNHFDTEFAKPLRHSDHTHEYHPTQFFAEWAKEHGYDGLRYSSAMSEGGRNLVSFAVDSVEIRSSRLVRVDAVKVTYGDYTGEDD